MGYMWAFVCKTVMRVYVSRSMTWAYVHRITDVQLFNRNTFDQLVDYFQNLHQTIFWKFSTQFWEISQHYCNYSPYASSNILLLNAIMNLTMVPFHLSNLTTSVPKCRFSFDQEVSLSNNKEGASIDKCIYGQTIKTNTYFIDGSWPKTIHWTIFISV